MIGPTIDQLVTRFATEAGYRLVASGCGECRIARADVELVVREEGGAYALESFERGASNGLELVASELRIVHMFLVLWVGDGWRSAHDLGLLQGTDGTPSDGFEVEAEREFAYGVRGPDSQWVAREMRDVFAQMLAVAVGYEVAEVVAAYKRRNGAPVFTPARRRGLWQRRGDQSG